MAKKNNAPDTLPADFDFNSAPDTLPAGFDFGQTPQAAQGISPSPTDLANSVLSKYGINVKAPAFSARQAPDVNQNPIARAAVSTGANMPSPLDIGKGLLTGGWGQAISGIQQSAQGMMRGTPSNVDDVAAQAGINAKSVRENADNRDYPGLVGNAMGPILTLAMMKAASSKLPIEPGTGKGYAASVPPEIQARMITRAVNPAETEWNSYLQSVSREGGNIAATAQQKGLPLNTNQDYANAAKLAAEDAKNHYKNNILKPVENDTVRVGEDFNGRKLQVGNSTQYETTVGELENRLDSINDQLRPSYIKKETGQVLTALEKTDLQAEQKALASQLYKELGTRTNLPPEQIKALRQRYGSLYQIADQTQAAVNAREKLVANRAEGRDVPESISESVFRGINKLRGGPIGNADRALRNALGNTNLPSSALPNAVAKPLSYNLEPNPVRTPLPNQVNTSGIDLTTFRPNAPEAAQAVQQNLSVRQAANRLDQTRMQNGITQQHESLTGQQAARIAARKQRISDLLKNNPATEIGYDTGR